MTLPRVYFSVQGHPVAIDGWSANSTANLGYDQFRGRMRSSQAQESVFYQGAVLTAHASNGVKVWEGRIAAPPQISQDGTATVAAQGHGYGAVKRDGRFALRVADGAAWAAGSTPPLNAPIVPSTGTVNVSFEAEDITVAVSRILYLWFTTVGSLTRGSGAIWAPGTRFTGFTASYFPIQIAGATSPITVYTADGPDLLHTMRPEYEARAAGAVQNQIITFTRPGDAVVIEFRSSSALTSQRWKIARGLTLFGDTPAVGMYADDGARTIGGILGWDTSGVLPSGGALITHFDHTSAVTALSTLAGQDDLCWGVFGDEGLGPRLEFGPYGGHRVWEVSARTGARWELAPLEIYNRVVAQYATTAGETLSGVGVFPTEKRILNQIVATADPDPLYASGMVNELGVAVSGTHFAANYPTVVAHRMLRAALEQRWMGRVSFARAFESGTGREATYEVRAGDLLRITDFTTDGALTLRVHDVGLSPDGVVTGHDAPSLPTALIVPIGAGSVSANPAAAVPESAATDGGGGGGDIYTPTPPPRRGPSPNIWKNPHR